MSKNNKKFKEIQNEAVMLFSKLKPFQDLQHDAEPRHYKLFSKWLQESDFLLDDEEFIKTNIVHLICKINELAKNAYTHKMVISSLEAPENDYFIKNILKRSRIAFPYIGSHDFSKLLGSLIHIGFNPVEDDPKFMDEWFDYSQKHIKGCSAEDMYKSLNEFAIMKITPPQRWMIYWFKHSEKCGWHTKLHKHVQLVRNLKSLNIPIDEYWLASWAEGLVPLLEKNKIEISGIYDIYHLADAIKYTRVYQNSTVMKLWFKKSRLALKHKDMDNKRIKHIFNQVMKIECNVPNLWISAFVEHFSKHFKSMEIGEKSKILYNLACLHVEDVEIVKPFLEQCRSYFSNPNLSIFKVYQPNYLRNVLIAQNYFETKGFSLRLDISKYADVLNVLKQEEKRKNELKDKVFAYLKESLGVEIIQNHWLGCIVNTVDMFIPSQKICIELYDDQYFVEEKLKKHVCLKHHLLNSENYSIVSLDSREFNGNCQERCRVF